MAENNKLYKLIFLRNLREVTQLFRLNRIYKKHSSLPKKIMVLILECDRLRYRHSFARHLFAALIYKLIVQSVLFKTS